MNKYEPEELAALQSAAPEMFEALLLALPFVIAAKSDPLKEVEAKKLEATIRAAIAKSATL